MEHDVEFNLITNDISSDLKLFLKINKRPVNVLLGKVSFYNDDKTFSWLNKIPLINNYIKDISYSFYIKEESKNIIVGTIQCYLLNLRLINKDFSDIYLFLELLGEYFPEIDIYPLTSFMFNDMFDLNNKENVLIIKNVNVNEKYRYEGIGKYLFKSVDYIIPYIYGFNYNLCLFSFQPKNENDFGRMEKSFYKLKYQCIPEFSLYYKYLY